MTDMLAADSTFTERLLTLHYLGTTTTRRPPCTSMRPTASRPGSAST